MIGIIRLSHKNNGFTLIELLVVIAIIAVLAAILFPVFAKAREKSRQTTCTSNQRQIALSIQMYAQDHGGFYPSGTDVWSVIALDPKIKQCPSVSSANTNSYGYNDALSGFAITGVTDPLKILLTADSSSSTNLLKTMADIDQMRHSNKFIATFPDGHVSVLDSGALNNSAFLYYIDITEQLWNGKTDGLWSIDPNGASGGGQIKSNSIYLYGWTRSGTGLVLDFDPILPGNQAASTGTIKFSAVFPNRGGDNNPNRGASASNMCTSIILCGDSSYSTAVPASRLCEYGVNGSATSSPSSYTSYLGLNSAATYTALSPLCLNGSGGTVTMVCDLNSGGKSSLSIKGAACNGTTVGGQVTTPVVGIWCGVVNSHSGDMTFSNVKFIYYK